MHTFKLIRLGNLGGYSSGSYGGQVYGANGLCPTLNSMGGGGRMPHIIARVTTNTGKTHQGNEVFDKHSDCPTIRAEAHGNLPMVITGKLNKSSDGKFLSMDDCSVKSVGVQVSGSIAARYYKGLGSNNDNLAIVAVNTDDGCCRTLKGSCGRISIENMSRQDSFGGGGGNDD